MNRYRTVFIGGDAELVIAKNNDKAATWSTRLCRMLITVLVLIWPLSGFAQFPLDEDRVETYNLGGRTLEEFFESFLADQGVSVTISEAVAEETRTLRGERSGTPLEIFRSLLNTNQLVAYHDGRTIHIYKENEVGRRFLAVDEERMDAAQRAIVDIAGSGDVNTVSVVEPGLLRVTGVPEFLEEAAGLTQAFGQRGEEEEMVFRFFELDYAWADDREFQAANRTMVIPGVATVLRQLISGTASGAPRGTVENSRRSESLRGEGLARYGESGGGDAQAALAQISQAEQRGGADGDGSDDTASDRSIASAMARSGGPTIVPAPGGQGVIVKDSADRMPMYAQLIDALDEEPLVLEIEATIISINVDRLQELGIEWRSADGDGDTEGLFAEEGTKADFINTLAQDDVAALGQLPGFQLGAILSEDGRFIARINALEDDGAARIVSRPTVVTLNGLEAAVESSEQVFVPVEGAFEVDLFDVFAGTVLRVTPHVNESTDPAQIRMFINVSDGSVETSLVEGDGDGQRQPRVIRNAVTTQAMIRNGQSLLLGGLTEEQAQTSETKVPVLGDIPVLGALFRSRSQTQQRTERLFLLRPRLVDPAELARGGRQQLPNASRDALDAFESDEMLKPRSDTDVAGDGWLDSLHQDDGSGDGNSQGGDRQDDGDDDGRQIHRNLP